MAKIPISESSRPRARPRRGEPLRQDIAGLVVALAVVAFAFGLRSVLGIVALSPLITGLVVGAVIGNALGVSDWARTALKSSLRLSLRTGIVLLGLQLTLQNLAQLGGSGLALVVGSLLATFLATLAAGRLLGVEPGLTRLIAAGTAVCGASAVMAANTVVRAEEEDVAYAMACVTLFGSLAVFLYPALAAQFALSDKAYALWSGASIHEIAQVAAAAAGHEAAGAQAMVVKLARVALLAPLVLGLGAFDMRSGRARAGAQAKVETPWFLIGFLAMMLLASTGLVPASALQAASGLVTVLLTLALAALGLGLNLLGLRAKGWRPLALGAGASVFISAAALGWALLLP